jgi:RNA polymerase sigma factor (sigma-70 family)
MNVRRLHGARTAATPVRRASPTACMATSISTVASPQSAAHTVLGVIPTKAPQLTRRMDRDLENWFVSVILPHQSALTGFLKRVCKSPNDVPDLRQETYIRVCESAAKSRPSFPKAFLFATARNLVIDRLRRERLVAVDHVPNGVPLDLSIDELTPERRVAARQDLLQLTRAFASLPETTRSVIWLRRVAGLSQREAAASLGIDEGALEGHMTRGMRRLARAVVPKWRREKEWLSVSGLSTAATGRQ